MTLMGMRGAMAVSAFGRGAALAALPIGSFGLFASAIATPTTKFTELYAYASDTVTAGTALTVQVAASYAAAGIATKAIVCSGNSLKTTNLYNYATNATLAGGQLGTILSAGTGCCNTTTALFVGGSVSGGKLTNLYDFPSDTAAQSTTLTAAVVNPASAANSSYVIIANGNGTNGITAKFQWGTGSVSVGTTLAHAYVQGAASSNITYGIFFGQTTAVSKYIWSGETSVLGTVGPVTIALGVAVGNDTEAVYVSGASAATQTYKYQYSDDSIPAGAVLLRTINSGAAASQGITGVSA